MHSYNEPRDMSHTHAHTHTRTHARAHTHTHTHTHTQHANIQGLRGGALGGYVFFHQRRILRP